MFDEYLVEKADFSILPQFTQQTEKYPELKQYQSIIGEIETLCNETNTEVLKVPTLQKILRNLMKILNGYMNLSSVTSIIMLQPLYYIISRVCSYVLEMSEQELAKNDLKKFKVKLEENMKNAKDKRSKAKFKDMIAKIDETIDKLENDDIEEHIREKEKNKNEKKENVKSEKNDNKKTKESKSTTTSIKESFNDSMILIDDQYLVEKADVQAKDLISPFTLPLCNKYPEMNKYKNIASECEEYFKSNDIKGTKANVVLGKLNKMFNEMLTTSSDIGYIASIFSANIPAIVLTRIIKLISMNNEVDSAKEILIKNKQSLESCKAKCKNSNESKKIDQLIKKCDDAINDLENNTNEDHEKWALKQKQERIKAKEAKKAAKINEKNKKESERKNKDKQFDNKIKSDQKQKAIKESSFYDLMATISYI